MNSLQAALKTTITLADVIVCQGLGGPMNRLYSYILPPELMGAQVGSLVEVPFGREQKTGLIFALSVKDLGDEASQIKLKEISALRLLPALPASYLAFIDAAAKHYGLNAAQAAKSIVPFTLLAKLQPALCLSEDLEGLKASAKTGKNITEKKLRKLIGEKQGFLEKLWAERKITHSLAEPRQAQKQTPKITLNPEQAQANTAIQRALGEEQSKEILLFGVTGSGKTEVYLEAIATVLAQGKQALLLMPEINLTEHLYERLAARLGEGHVCKWHSGLGEKERSDTCLKILQGEPLLVVGARSAILLPFVALAVTIIDEEHDQSFKSHQAPYFDARILAGLARNSGSVLLYGSATPSVALFERAQRAEVDLLELKARHGAMALPSVQIVDLREELACGNRSIFSRSLQAALKKIIAEKKQAILLLNRRGFSTYVFCRDCGQAIECASCSVTMVYHAREELLRCHQCDSVTIQPKTCPSCNSARIKYAGLGTQKLEEEVKKTFPEADVLRLDRDSLRLKGEIERVWSWLQDGERESRAQILVGTQLLAKGLDLPRVELVCVLQAESGLHFPDYRARERCYQLLVQAAGRAGRRERQGMAIFQTFEPEQVAITLAARQDYLAFFEQEIVARQRFGYPPFASLLRFVFSAPKLETSKNDAQLVAEALGAEWGDSIQILGPAICPVARRKDQYRHHLLLKMGVSSVLSLEALGRLVEGLGLRSQLSFELDPTDFL